MIEVDDWEPGDRKKIPYTLPESIQSIDFSYDGGRLSVYINSDEVVSDSVGHDVSVTINNLDIPEEE